MGKKLDKLAARIVALEKAVTALVTGKKPQSKNKGNKKKRPAKGPAKPAKPAKKARSKKPRAKAAPMQPPIGNL